MRRSMERANEIQPKRTPKENCHKLCVYFDMASKQQAGWFRKRNTKPVQMQSSVASEQSQYIFPSKRIKTLKDRPEGLGMSKTFYEHDPAALTFENEVSKVKYDRVRMVVRTFLQAKHGITVFRKELAKVNDEQFLKELTKNKAFYQNAIDTVAVTFLDTIEEFLILECEYSFYPMSIYHRKMLDGMFFNFRMSMVPSMQETVIKVVNGTYGLETTTINELECYEIYLFFKAMLKRRLLKLYEKDMMVLTQREQLRAEQEVARHQLDNNVLLAKAGYLNGHDRGAITLPYRYDVQPLQIGRFFMKLYKHNRADFTPEGISKRMGHVALQGAAKISEAIALRRAIYHQNIPPMVRLSPDKLTQLSKHRDGMEIICELVEYYREDCLMDTDLEDFVRILNTAVMKVTPRTQFDQHLLIFRRNKGGGLRKKEVRSQCPNQSEAKKMQGEDESQNEGQSNSEGHSSVKQGSGSAVDDLGLEEMGEMDYEQPEAGFKMEPEQSLILESNALSLPNDRQKLE